MDQYLRRFFTSCSLNPAMTQFLSEVIKTEEAAIAAPIKYTVSVRSFLVLKRVKR